MRTHAGRREVPSTRKHMLTQEQIALESGPESNLERKASRDTRQSAAINLRFCHVSGVFRRCQTRQSHRLAADSTDSTRKCGWKAASGRWRAAQKRHRTGVRVQRNGRRTHRAYPVKSLILNRCRAARGGISGWSRENLRRATHRALSREERMLSTAGRGRRRKAPSISPSSAPPLPSVLHAHHAALRRAQLRRCATGAAVGLRQGPAPPHRSAGEGSAPRCGGSSRANPTLPQRTPAPASRADRTHSRPPSRRTGRS